MTKIVTVVHGNRATVYFVLKWTNLNIKNTQDAIKFVQVY